MQTKGPLQRINAWQPRVFATEAFRWLAPAAHFSGLSDWPSLATINEVFLQHRVTNSSGQALQAVASPKKKPAKPAVSYNEFYEPRVYTLGELFTRENHWHDLLNACVWATFPKTKAALNRRHYAAFSSRNPLPVHALSNRSPEQDALTLFDEGGGIIVRQSSSYKSDLHILFGHGAYECLIYERLNFTSAAIVLDCRDDMVGEKALLAWIDHDLATFIADPQKLLTPRDFCASVIENFLS